MSRLAAAVVAATAATAVAAAAEAETIAAAAEDDDEQDDDPAAVATAKSAEATIVTTHWGIPPFFGFTPYYENQRKEVTVFVLEGSGKIGDSFSGKSLSE